MPHRYFHLQNGVTTLDHVGSNVADMAATRAEALATIAAALHEDKMDTLWGGSPVRLWVTDGPGGSGRTLFTLRVTSEQ